MAEHTPGPWHYIGDEDGDFVIYAGEEFIANIGQPIQAVCENPKTKLVAFDLDQANTRLIAAAPETAAERDRLLEVNTDLVSALGALAGWSAKVLERGEVDMALFRELSSILELSHRSLAKAQGETS